MTDRRKFAGVTSQLQKGKSHLVQCPANMADGHTFELAVADALDSRFEL
jgi:hypothetical protein